MWLDLQDCKPKTARLQILIIKTMDPSVGTGGSWEKSCNVVSFYIHSAPKTPLTMMPCESNNKNSLISYLTTWAIFLKTTRSQYAV